MNTTKRYSSEFRERAVRLVRAGQNDNQSEWAAILSVSEKLGRNRETPKWASVFHLLTWFGLTPCRAAIERSVRSASAKAPEGGRPPQQKNPARPGSGGPH